ncbi:TOBE domain-containing protein [Paludibacterium purpuratum]|uniref:Molybdopterin-binding protein n=1 Tax=Paludibacterium purpuratum TaxID=1144873 RepID=A0A4R7AW89_9NEIS|nr:TOBE domain-containing protein [Paludibacterium purpuratum]TDR71653.1 molybdopterin-binding protein [Paludibacterium purpuratum]
MKSSARNQFSGVVKAVRTGAVNDEIELELLGGQVLVAVVTHESARTLGLSVGREAVALIKSSSVIVVTDDQGVLFSARNHLRGKIARVTPGAVNSEVLIDVEGVGQIAAIVTNESCAALALAVDRPASALFKASSVIVGVKG